MSVDGGGWLPFASVAWPPYLEAKPGSQRLLVHVHMVENAQQQPDTDTPSTAPAPASGRAEPLHATRHGPFTLLVVRGSSAVIEHDLGCFSQHQEIR